MINLVGIVGIVVLVAGVVVLAGVIAAILFGLDSALGNLYRDGKKRNDGED